MLAKLLLFGAALCFAQAGAVAAVIGTNPPAEPLTMERIATLSEGQQDIWKKYLTRSGEQWQTDRAVFTDELKKNHIEKTTTPPHSGSARSIPMDESADWYDQKEAQHIADIVVSFQTPAGGWSKNIDMTQHERAPGEYFNSDNRSKRWTATDNDLPRDPDWNYVGTFDNDATITELRYLAKVINTHRAPAEAKYRASFRRGMDYIHAAQYPNGGWPQVWPLEGGYHDTITYNDDAMLNVIMFLKDVADGSGPFAFTDSKTRAAAAASVRRGIECLLATQIKINGHRTVWCQQHDPLTLAPASARNYEMPSECGAESSDILTFLMALPNPDDRTVAAIYAGTDWFKKVEIRDFIYERVNGDHKLIAKPGGGPLWARYYDLQTDHPIFGDRDKTIHDDVREISYERRNGYSWYSGKPQSMLSKFAAWSKNHPQTKTAHRNSPRRSA